MNKSEKISKAEIIKMVEDWYEGSIDSNRDEVLFAYFTEKPVEEIPEELKDEIEIFRSLALANTPCPDHEFLDLIDSEIRQEKKKVLGRRVLKYTAWLSSAACIGALIFGLSYFKMDKSMEPATTPLVKATTFTEPIHKATNSQDTVKYLHPTDISDKIAVNNVPKRKKSKASQLREVTDINEAVAIINMIDNNLSETLSSGMDAINKAENGFKKADEITSRILNNINI